MKKIVVFLFSLFLLASCGGKNQKVISTLNSDVLHTENGFMLLKRKHYGLAKAEFDKATNANKKYSLAYMGRAVVYLSQKKLDEAHDELQKALKYAKSDEDTIKVKSGLIQFFSSPSFVKLHYGKDAWLVMARQEFDDAKKIRKSEEIYFHMAIAYSLNFEFSKAYELLDEIIKTENAFTLLAKEQKKRISSIERMVEKHEKSSPIIFDEFLTRGQLSYILVEIFKLDEKLKTSPETLSLQGVSVSPYSESIQKAIGMNLMSLSLEQDNTYRPNKHVTRAELAYLLMELNERLEGKVSKGKDSKFSDVSKNDWFYQSVTFASGQELLKEKDMLTMEFRPLEEVSVLEGIEALDKLLKNN